MVGLINLPEYFFLFYANFVFSRVPGIDTKWKKEKKKVLTMMRFSVFKKKMSGGKHIVWEGENDKPQRKPQNIKLLHIPPPS